MQFDFTRKFTFRLASDIELTVKYSGELLSFLENSDYHYAIEIGAIDQFYLTGGGFHGDTSGLDYQLEDMLLERAYEDAMTHIDEIHQDLDESMKGLS